MNIQVRMYYLQMSSLCLNYTLGEKSGLFFRDTPQKYTFRGTLTLVNLGSHFLGGFKQLSSATRKCHHCYAIEEDMCNKVYM